MVRVIKSGKYLQMLREMLKDYDLETLKLVNKRVDLFIRNSSDTRLRNHPLSGKMAGQFAFSITDDIRIIYEIVGKNIVRFLAIGPHEKVY